MSNPRPVRYRCELWAQLQPEDAPPVQARVLELSERGAFVEEPQGLELQQVGDELTLGIALPGGDAWVVQGRVVRSGHSRLELSNQAVDHVTVLAQGYALEFLELPEEDLERLRDFLELLDAR